MEATIEISMYPLREGYIEPIDFFIDQLRENKEIEVRVNETSTHIFGDYDLVFDALKDGVRRSFEKYGKAIFVLKILNGNLKS